MTLGLDEGDLAACVSCGLCLPHCPTYRVTGAEAASPRGRIAAMRQVQWHDAPVDDEFEGFMDACVQCRSCEAACPSGVRFGSLMATTRAALVREVPDYLPPLRRAPYHLLAHPVALRAATRLGGVAQRAGVLPRRLADRLGLPGRLPVRIRPRRASGTDVYLFTGCVMDAWQRPVHHATQLLLEAAGFGVQFPASYLGGCCGALHEHAGLSGEAFRRARMVLVSMPDGGPIVVDSAGCGAALLAYPEVLGPDPRAEEFADRVHDVHEFLAERRHLLPRGRRLQLRVAVQDPCHLGPSGRQGVRDLLTPHVDLIDLDGLCCGAGGAYRLHQPELAAELRQRLLAQVRDVDLVVSANPGCSLHLAGGPVPVVHPVEVLAEALGLVDARLEDDARRRRRHGR